jgi:hypothetical protein
LAALFVPRSKQRHKQQAYVLFCWLSVLTIVVYVSAIWLIPLSQRLLHAKNSPVVVPGWNMMLSWVLLSLLVTVLLGLVIRFSCLGFSLLRSIAARVRAPGKQRAAWRQQFRRSCRLWPGGLMLIVTLSVVMVTYFAQARHLRPPEQPLLLAERVTNLASGVTPVVPVVILGLASLFWSICQLRRLCLLEVQDKAVLKPFPSNRSAVQFAVINTNVEKSRDILRSPLAALNSRAAFVVWLLVFYCLWRLSCYVVPFVDGTITETIILYLLSVLVLVIVFGWFQLMKAWECVRATLQAVAELPLGDSFGRIPAVVTDMMGALLSSDAPGWRAYLPYRAERYDTLANEYRRLAPQLNALAEVTSKEDGRLKAAFGNRATSTGVDPGTRKLCQAARACLVVLGSVWSEPRRAKKLANGGFDPEVEGWFRLAQDFVALEIATYVSQFMVQLRNLASFLTLAPLLMLFAVTSYPVQPQRLWVLFVIVLMSVVTATVIWGAIQAERNELISRISKTVPNQVSFQWNFLSSLALYAIPLLGIVVAISDDSSDLVHSWIDPLLQVFK